MSSSENERHKSPAHSAELKAVLWDMDGTIIDSEPYWINAEIEIAQRFGVEWTEEKAMMLVGQALPNSAQILIDHGVQMSIREIIDEMTHKVIEQIRQSIPWRPGARELLAELKAEGIPMALVTMSEGPMARAVAENLPEATFDVFVTGDRVDQGKPHPEAYELAWSELSLLHGLDAHDQEGVVALEDSWPGYQSAVSAGFSTIAIPFHVALPEPRDGKSRIEWKTLEGRKVEDLRAIVSA